MRALWLLPLLSGCVFEPVGTRLDDRTPFTGTVTLSDARFDDETFDVVLYRMYEDEWFPTDSSGPTASGVVHTSGEPMTVYFQLAMTGWEEAYAAGATEWPVVDKFSQDAFDNDWWAAVSWVEWEVDERTGTESIQIWRSVFGEGPGTLVSGAVTDVHTDWTEKIEGHVSARLEDEDNGDVRQIELDFAWGDVVE